MYDELTLECYRATCADYYARYLIATSTAERVAAVAAAIAARDALVDYDASDTAVASRLDELDRTHGEALEVLGDLAESSEARNRLADASSAFASADPTRPGDGMFVQSAEWGDADLYWQIRRLRPDVDHHDLPAVLHLCVRARVQRAARRPRSRRVARTRGSRGDPRRSGSDDDPPERGKSSDRGINAPDTGANRGGAA
jgi:hypothetical protein